MKGNKNEEVPLDIDSLFQLTMEKKWEKVCEQYENNRLARIAKLTKTEETALHVAVSSYHAERVWRHEIYIKRMIDCMSFNDLSRANDKGNTALHLAASVGWVSICERIATKDRKLILVRNARGETPLFVAAQHGKLQAFLCLHELDKERRDQERDDADALCRRKDGNTILHSAIYGEYFRLAHQIICYYPELVNSVNVEGETPLHVLAKKPNVFKSSIHLGLYDSFIYQCMFVHELKEEKYNPADITNAIPLNISYPENYQTCVNIFFLIFTPIFKSILAGFPWLKKQNGSSTGEENQQQINSESKRKKKEQEGKRYGFVPPNYTTMVLLFKFSMKVILTVVGVGFGRIHNIQVKKQRYSDASKIMNNMIEFGQSYKYDNNGQQPDQKLDQTYSGRIELPPTPPSADEPERQGERTEINTGTTSSTEDLNNREIEKDQSESENMEKDALAIQSKVNERLALMNIELTAADKQRRAKLFQDGEMVMVFLRKERSRTANDGQLALDKKDTPLLVAAKMGILEMVEKILKIFPVAFQDLDSEGKNVLLLAAENRQTSVFDYLMKMKLPEYVFHQTDNDGNSILHLAAMLGEFQPWRIPGSALQMQWEIKWYEHVKRSVPPLSFVHHNCDGETPRMIFTRTHKLLLQEGTSWLIKTSESCSVVAALIAGVAFATSATVPGGLDQNSGQPVLRNHTAFDVFSISSLIALCLSVTALVFFLAIITSRCEERDFEIRLPRKLLFGLTFLFQSIAAMLVSFCAGHTFILRDKLKFAAVPIYAIACLPVTIFCFAQLPLYFDLLKATFRRVPLRSYQVFYQ